MKNQIDIIKMANTMQKERELDHEVSIPDPVRFEQSFNDIFCGDEVVKPKRTDQEMLDHGHKWSDF